MTCPCDTTVHPEPLDIAAGLTRIPRQIAGFAELRRAMMTDVRGRSALAGWQIGHDGDLGLMLIEMWAVLADMLAFYDEVHAHECYLRTARLRSSVRRLVDLLGYRPRPAVAATVRLAILAEGRRSITLPAGTAFRSGSFDAEAPQVFELDADTAVHPLTSKWKIQGPRATTAGETGGPGENATKLWLDPKTAKLAEGDVVFLRHQNGEDLRQVRHVSAVASIEGDDGDTYTEVTFDEALDLPASTVLSDLRFYRGTQTCALWTQDLASGDAAPIHDVLQSVTLDGIYRTIKVGQYIVLDHEGEIQAFKVTKAAEVARDIAVGSYTDVDGNELPTTAKVPATVLTLTHGPTKAALGSDPWINDNMESIAVHYQLVDSGRAMGQARASIAPTDTLLFDGTVEAPSDGTSPTTFQIRDLDQTGVQVSGTVDFASKTLLLATGETWTPDLAAPAEIFGNVVSATRGETVSGEVLGSGDGSQSHQSFELKKSPLTYVSAPGTTSGVAASLTVYVDGIAWTEAASFYGVGATDRVYIVRQNDDGESTITFGDGIRGSRLPSGTSNVKAYYRFGAGSASPPAGSIQQIAKAVKGMTAVVNPVAAAGGDDAEAAEDMQESAPRTALTLGRAVSILDMEAIAASTAGVRAAKAEWRWDGTRQRPVVQIWIIGESGIESTVAAQVTGASDPSTPIEVTAATSVPVDLVLDVTVADDHVEEDVTAAVIAALMDEDTGLLPPERIGIGVPFYRSRLSAAVLGVGGVENVTAQWNGETFSDYAVSPGAGAYFDVEAGSLRVNDEEYDGGE